MSMWGRVFCPIAADPDLRLRQEFDGIVVNCRAGELALGVCGEMAGATPRLAKLGRLFTKGR
ncbi:hypothetical protein LOM8899_00044 [Flavimaricola marinus]|uniref:Uncharacterized protein n=1 Tax=Flavimaricola marinus TaxID=1819565 RepID=A0A238L8L5_9RHOB|nr:hypothetical protein LOM8899_00044 [Flavimaricola marinus]